MSERELPPQLERPYWQKHEGSVIFTHIADEVYSRKEMYFQLMPDDELKESVQHRSRGKDMQGIGLLRSVCEVISDAIIDQEVIDELGPVPQSIAENLGKYTYACDHISREDSDVKLGLSRQLREGLVTVNRFTPNLLANLYKYDEMTVPDEPYGSYQVLEDLRSEWLKELLLELSVTSNGVWGSMSTDIYDSLPRKLTDSLRGSGKVFADMFDRSPDRVTSLSIVGKGILQSFMLDVNGVNGQDFEYYGTTLGAPTSGCPVRHTTVEIPADTVSNTELNDWLNPLFTQSTTDERGHRYTIFSVSQSPILTGLQLIADTYARVI